MPSSRARSTPAHAARRGRRRSPSSQAASARLCERAANSSCRSREIAEPLGQLLVGLAERDRPLRRHPLVDQPPAQRRRDRGDVAGREGARRLGQHPRRPGHRLDAAGQHDVGVAGLDGPRARHRGVQRRAAEPVHRDGRHRDRQARPAAPPSGRRCGCPHRPRWRCPRPRRRSARGPGPGAFASTPVIAVAARSSGRTSASAPPNRPNGVRAAAYRIGGGHGVLLVADLLGDAERGVGGGHAAVDRGLQQDLLDLVHGQAVAAGGAQVQRQLLVVAAGDQRGERDHRAAAPVEPGPGPDPAPGVLGDQLLELAGEVGGSRQRRSTCSSPSTSRRTASCPSLALGASGLSGSRRARAGGSGAATSAGRSAGARCATSSRTTSRPSLHAVGDARAAGRAGSRGRARRRPPAPAAAISPSRSRTSNAASAPQTWTYPSSAASRERVQQALAPVRARAP